MKEKYGGVERAIEQGSAYRVLRSIFPMAQQRKENSEVRFSLTVFVSFIRNHKVLRLI
jgi:hypothetical protein